MSRYTRDQLREMAQTTLNAKANRDDRYITLVMLIVARTQLTPTEIHQRIERLARS